MSMACAVNGDIIYLFLTEIQREREEKRNFMENLIKIKGIRIGQPRPVICIPVVAEEKEEIIDKIRELGRKKVPMIEWRADLFREVEDTQQVSEILEAVKDAVSDTVFLFTIRTVRQGGCGAMEEKTILYLNELAAKSGCVDLIDLEFFEATRPEKAIRRLQRMGVKVIASHHDFQETPDNRILRMLLEQMEAGGADIAKLAVMPQTPADVLRLMELTNEIRTQHPGLLVVTMAMGGLGAVSRIGGELFGSCITFGAQGETSAPGQLQADVLDGILDVIHKSMDVQ